MLGATCVTIHTSCYMRTLLYFRVLEVRALKNGVMLRCFLVLLATFLQIAHSHQRPIHHHHIIIPSSTRRNGRRWQNHQCNVDVSPTCPIRPVARAA